MTSCDTSSPDVNDPCDRALFRLSDEQFDAVVRRLEEPVDPIRIKSLFARKAPWEFE